MKLNEGGVEIRRERGGRRKDTQTGEGGWSRGKREDLGKKTT